MKIIKNGQIEFTAHCPVCGCEFTYETKDIANVGSVDKVMYVKCPSCKHPIDHKTPYDTLNIPYIAPGVTPYIPFTGGCDDCEWLKSRTNGIYVGDIPCQWCSKSPLRVSCLTECHS